jgi:hypothetical protein
VSASLELRSALEELRRTRAVLRSQPRRRAPRNFTLTPQMAARRAPGAAWPARLFPAMRLSSALASALLAVVLLADLLGVSPAAAPRQVAEAPAAGTTAQEMPVMEAAPDMLQQAPKAAAEEGAAPEAETMRSMLQATGEPSSVAAGAYPPAAADTLAEGYSAYPDLAGQPPVATPEGEADTLALQAPADLTSTTQIYPYPYPAQSPAPAFVYPYPLEEIPNAADSWLWVEIGLAVVAILTAVIAFILRRTGNL